MQLQIRASQTHILECEGSENILQIKVGFVKPTTFLKYFGSVSISSEPYFLCVFQDRVSTLEGIPRELLCLYSAGAPLGDEFAVSDLACTNIDVTVPLLGGKF